MNTYSVRAQIRRDRIRKKDGKAPVILRVGINSKQEKISTGIYIHPDDWNREKSEIRKTHPDYNALNIEIRNCVAIANQIFDEYRRARITLTASMFRQAYSHPSSRDDFLAYMQVGIDRRFAQGEIVAATRTKHRTVLKRLRQYQREIRFSEISQNLIYDFDFWYLNFLKKSRGDTLVNHGQGARSNAQKIIKTYLKRAQKDKIDFEMPEFDTKQVFEEAEFLTEKQVRKLMRVYDQAHLHPDHWREVLRVFLWMCFTGQSFTDAMGITWKDNILNDRRTLRYIRNKQLRYRKTVIVPITPIAGTFLPDTEETDHVFYQHKNQVFNRTLKNIAKHVRFKVKLSSKVARDTFGTLFCEAVGGDVFTLMDIMGHSKIETTRKYVHLSQGHKERQVYKAFERFNPEM